ncbi:MAG: hypothetical protein HYY84_02090 [Deltaproteobacteria bacterium]|nr:hypothetical protein [Deltaproteobacteria bacterium]
MTVKQSIPFWALLIAALVPASPSFAASEPADTLVRRIRTGAGPRLLSDVLDELMDDLTSDLAKRSAKSLSPIAIRAVRVGPTLNASAIARIVEQGLIRRLKRYTRVVPVKCATCDAFTTRLEGGNWLLKRGVASAADMRVLRRDQQIEALLDITVDHNAQTGVATLRAEAFGTEDGRIVFTESYDSDRSSAELLRTGEILRTRKERAGELEKMLKGRPDFEVGALFGLMTLPHNKSQSYGTIIGVRLAERFGLDWRHTFGFEGSGYFNFSSVAAAMIGVSYWWTFVEPSLFAPDWRMGWGMAAVIVGTEGNTAAFSYGIEARLKRRFSLVSEVHWVIERELTGRKFGGAGYRMRFGVNW